MTAGVAYRAYNPAPGCRGPVGGTDRRAWGRAWRPAFPSKVWLHEQAQTGSYHHTHTATCQLGAKATSYLAGDIFRIAIRAHISRATVFSPPAIWLHAPCPPRSWASL